MAEALDELLKSYADGNTTTFLDFDVVEINSVGHDKRTPLHVACSHDAAHDVKLLLASGANVNARDSIGHTPLHTAVYHRNPLVVQLLVGAGADPHIRSDFGESPLDRAREDGMTEIVSILEEARDSRRGKR